jgi:hypothetical protein
MYRANYPVYNPSDYWKISIYLVFLDHLVEEISKRVVSNEERFFHVFGRFLLLFFVGGASYNNPASLLNLTPEIVDRRFNAYQRDLPKKVHFVDVVERWKISWAFVDDKPERLLDTLCNATTRDLYSAIYSIVCILLTMSVSSATNERSFSAIRRVKSYLLSTIGDK